MMLFDLHLPENIKKDQEDATDRFEKSIHLPIELIVSTIGKIQAIISCKERAFTIQDCCHFCSSDCSVATFRRFFAFG